MTPTTTVVHTTTTTSNNHVSLQSSIDPTTYPTQNTPKQAKIPVKQPKKNPHTKRATATTVKKPSAAKAKSKKRTKQSTSKKKHDNLTTYSMLYSPSLMRKKRKTFESVTKSAQNSKIVEKDLPPLDNEDTLKLYSLSHLERLSNDKRLLPHVDQHIALFRQKLSECNVITHGGMYMRYKRKLQDTIERLVLLREKMHSGEHEDRYRARVKRFEDALEWLKVKYISAVDQITRGDSATDIDFLPLTNQDQHTLLSFSFSSASSPPPPSHHHDNNNNNTKDDKREVNDGHNTSQQDNGVSMDRIHNVERHNDLLTRLNQESRDRCTLGVSDIIRNAESRNQRNTATATTTTTTNQSNESKMMRLLNAQYNLYKNEIISDFLLEIEQLNVPCEIINQDECENCGESLRLSPNNASMVCPFCSLEHPYIDTTAASVNHGDEPELSKFTYQRANHFKVCLSRIDEYADIPDIVYLRIAHELIERGIKDRDEITVPLVKEVMKFLNKQDNNRAREKKKRKADRHMEENRSKIARHNAIIASVDNVSDLGAEHAHMFDRNYRVESDRNPGENSTQETAHSTSSKHNNVVVFDDKSNNSNNDNNNNNNTTKNDVFLDGNKTTTTTTTTQQNSQQQQHHHVPLEKLCTDVNLLEQHMKFPDTGETILIKKFYHNVIQITRSLKGLAPRKLTETEKGAFCFMFKKIQAPFMRFKKGRDNLISYDFCLRKFAGIIGDEELKSYFVLPKCDNNRLAYEKIWRKICRFLKWPIDEEDGGEFLDSSDEEDALNTTHL